MVKKITKKSHTNKQNIICFSSRNQFFAVLVDDVCSIINGDVFARQFYALTAHNMKYCLRTIKFSACTFAFGSRIIVTIFVVVVVALRYCICIYDPIPETMFNVRAHRVARSTGLRLVPSFALLLPIVIIQLMDVVCSVVCSRGVMRFTSCTLHTCMYAAYQCSKVYMSRSLDLLPLDSLVFFACVSCATGVEHNFKPVHKFSGDKMTSQNECNQETNESCQFAMVAIDLGESDANALRLHTIAIVPLMLPTNITSYVSNALASQTRCVCV